VDFEGRRRPRDQGESESDPGNVVFLDAYPIERCIIAPTARSKAAAWLGGLGFPQVLKRL
jgi:hypothetical protein